MDPKDFLVLADKLVNNFQNEAAFRTSVSRSYYALHTFMSNFFLKEKFDIAKDEKRHKKIYYYLHNCGIEEIKDIASALDDLRHDRNRADYEMDTVCHKKNARFAFIKASKAYEIFSRHINNPTSKSELKTGIREYIKRTTNQKSI